MSCCLIASQFYPNKYIYYMDQGILLGTKALVVLIRHYIRNLSDVFSVCYAYRSDIR